MVVMRVFLLFTHFLHQCTSSKDKPPFLFFKRLQLFPEIFFTQMQKNTYFLKNNPYFTGILSLPMLY